MVRQTGRDPTPSGRRPAPWRRLLWLLALLPLGLYVQHMAGLILPPARAACDDFTRDTLPPVVMVGASWCDFCLQTRWFLEERDVAYCEYDIDHSASGAALYRRLQTRALPVIWVGERRVDGFDKTRLADALREQGLI